MKVCPYCAEEIQGEAIYCRFCNKRVKGILIRRIVKLVIVAGLIIFILLNGFTIIRFVTNFFKEIDSLWKILQWVLVEMKNGLAAFKDYKQQMGGTM